LLFHWTHIFLQEGYRVPQWDRRKFLQVSLLTTLGVASGGAAWGKTPAPRLRLRHLHTGESLQVELGQPASLSPDSLQAIDHLLRCHHTGEVHNIDLHLINTLTRLDRKLGDGRELHVISGFRSRTYNEYLRQQGRKVAAASLHLSGQAIDIRIPGVDLPRLHRAALSLAAGGVGYYPRSGFVHLDCGPVRRW
jgi:uncharacterized protein YcbK (DUF882 family)